VPTGAELETVKVITEEQVGSHEVLAMEYETPLGTPETESDTASLVPATRVFVIVF